MLTGEVSPQDPRVGESRASMLRLFEPCHEKRDTKSAFTPAEKKGWHESCLANPHVPSSIGAPAAFHPLLPMKTFSGGNIPPPPPPQNFASEVSDRTQWETRTSTYFALSFLLFLTLARGRRVLTSKLGEQRVCGRLFCVLWEVGGGKSSRKSRSMSRVNFNVDMERAVMELYVEAFLPATGTTFTAAEKYARIADQLNENGKTLGWPVFSGQSVDSKIDSLKRKGKGHARPFARCIAQVHHGRCHPMVVVSKKDSSEP